MATSGRSIPTYASTLAGDLRFETVRVGTRPACGAARCCRWWRRLGRRLDDRRTLVLGRADGDADDLRREHDVPTPVHHVQLVATPKSVDDRCTITTDAWASIDDGFATGHAGVVAVRRRLSVLVDRSR